MQKTLILLCPRLKSPQQSWTVKNDRSKTDPRLLPACARIARGTRRLRAAPCEHLCAAAVATATVAVMVLCFAILVSLAF